MWAVRRNLLEKGLVQVSRSVLASLYPVNDEATSLFMQEFYRSLLQKGAMPTAALQDAQAKVRKKATFQHPTYWGAFVLYGDW